MHIHQIVPSFGEACGISYFAASMQRAILASGHTVSTSNRSQTSDCDVVVLHHHSELVTDDEVARMRRATLQPMVLFPHADDARSLYGLFDGIIAMTPALVEGTRIPFHLFPHPAWTPNRLEPRRALRGALGLPLDRYIVGTSGFLKCEREFDTVTEQLLVSGGPYVYLTISPWRLPSVGVVERLRSIERAAPDRLKVDYRYRPSKALNRRLQACDLLWCWTSAPSGAYASGVASDQYASGTRMVVADKVQHAHITQLPNVLATVGGVGSLCAAILTEALAGRSVRHDPAPVSWRAVLPGLLAFLEERAHRTIWTLGRREERF